MFPRSILSAILASMFFVYTYMNTFNEMYSNVLLINLIKRGAPMTQREVSTPNSRQHMGERARLGRLGYAKHRIMQHWQLYLVLSVPLILILLFSYGPMYGLQIAFKDYMARRGMFDSPFVGLKHFQSFIGTYQFNRLISNTIGISLYSLIAGFPIPIILAIMLNECSSTKYKKTVQMITYAPHFISTVVMVSIILLFLSPANNGILNNVLALFGFERLDFIAKPSYFKTIYVWSGVWQGMGYGSIIYLAALTGIDPCLHEAAVVDGASKLRRIWHIDIPGILPTVIILLIMNFGSLMNVGHEKVLLMQNQLNMSSSDIISTFVYRKGLTEAQYSYSTAVGLFNSVINTALLVGVNWISRRVSETSLW